jgi:3-deoxy-D-manno-octulosonic-acid transferase
MKFVYSFAVFLAEIVLPTVAIFSKKINFFVTGRKETFAKLAPLKNHKTIWFHTASLGEFEQARPIIEILKEQYSNYKILVTFFSPSGYEVRKSYILADVVCYLPLDSSKNMRKFITEVNPQLAIFIKYEFWPNLLKELKKKEIKTILVSGILRKEQLFFKSYGAFMRSSLAAFDHFFVQDINSKTLLNSIFYHNVTVAGDTRFDRVLDILKQDNFLDFIQEFKDNSFTTVAGSTWKEDEALLVNYINTKASADEKFIIAPHNIRTADILVLRQQIDKKTMLYSEFKQLDCDENLTNSQVFIIDTIGLLTKIYAAADVAYVGGGLKTGLHNILEPATFGIPVVIGNKFKKFKEAVDLVEIGGCISVRDEKELAECFAKLKTDYCFRKLTGIINKRYIQDHLGATKSVMHYIAKAID